MKNKNSIKKRLILLIWVTYLAVNLNLYAQQSSPFQFLRYASSARASALAGCFVAMPEDASAIYYNPATISTVEKNKFSITFLKHILDINSGNLSYILKLEDIGTFAGSIIYTNYGTFDYADQEGNITGTFSANDIGLAISYSNYLDKNLYYGATLKFLFNNIEKYTSSALAVDVGLIYRMPEKRTNIGLSILHTGMQLSKYENTTEKLPLDVRLGINHKLEGLPLLVNFSLHHLADKTNKFGDKFLNFSIAGELYLGEYLEIRLGYDNQIRRLTTPANEKKLAGISAGVGIKTNLLNLDYSIGQIGLSAYLHRISLGLDL